MLALKAFGTLDVRSDRGAPLTSLLTQSKRAALFTYLVLSRPGEMHRRDALLALFWPELDQTHGRNALSQSLSFLRRELGEGVLVTRGAEEVGVDAAAITSDVRTFEEALAAEDWVGAVEAYGGDLLEGLHVVGAAPFTDWVDRERERLREAASGAAWKLAHAKIAAGELTEAERVAQRALMLVPTDESPVRGFIEALAGAGDRAAALRFYERFREVLAEELEVEPAPETVAVMEAVRERTEAVDVASGSAGGGAEPSQAGPAPGIGEPAGRAEADGRLRLKRLVVAVALPLLLLAAGYGVVHSLRPATLFGTGKASPYDQVVVGDLAAPFDPGLGQTASELLRTVLDQSDVVRPVSPAQIGGALRLMERDPALPLDEAAARQVAARLGAPLLLLGEMQQVDDTYIVTVRLEAVTGGEVLGRFAADAESGKALVAALDELGGRVRARIGEARGAIRRSPPLAQVLTPSLEALRLYTEAVRLRDVEGRDRDAIPLLERAIELDTAFATAYRKLWITLANLNVQPERAAELHDKAWAHRDRLGEFDRIEVDFGWAMLNLPPEDGNECVLYGIGVALYETYVRRHPDDPRPLSIYGFYLASAGRRSEATAVYRRSNALTGGRDITYNNLFFNLLWAGDREGAREELSEWRQHLPEDPNTRWAAAQLALAERDYATADSILAVTPGADNRRILNLEFRVDAVRGRVREAQAHHRQAVSVYRREGGGANVAGAELEWELLRLVALGDTAEALEAAAAIFDAMPQADRLWRTAGPIFAMGGSIGRAHQVLDRMLGSGWWPNSFETHLLHAWIALAEGDPDQALALANAAEIGCYGEFDPRSLALVRGRAHEAAARGDSAIADYEAYVGGVARPWTDAIFLFDTLERLGRLHEQLGHDAEAATYYERAAELWKDADPELQPRVRQLRERAAALGDAHPPPAQQRR